jgi:uncharacterized protein (DUF2267 family)
MDANRFFEDVARRVGCDAARAEALASVVFHELRDRLTAKEAADVAAQLPERLRRLWSEDETPGGQPRKIHVHELIGRVRRHAALVDDREAERTVRAVFAALRVALGSPSGLEGEAWDVFSVLPKDIKPLWLPEPGAEAVS